MTETNEQHEEKGIVRRAYEEFKSIDATYRTSLGTFILGTGITFGSIVIGLTREGTPELMEHRHLENKLYSLQNTPVKVQDLLNEKYVNSLRTFVRSIEARKDSLESLSSFKIAKEDSEKSLNLWTCVAGGGLSIMAGSLVFDIAMRKKRRKVK